MNVWPFLQFHKHCIDDWLRNGHSVCPVDGISVHSRRHLTRRCSSKKKTEKLNKQTNKQSSFQDFSLVGHSALNLTTSLSGGGHVTAVGRIQRGMVTQHGRHQLLPIILPQLVIGSSADYHMQTANHQRQKPVRKSSKHKPLLPSAATPDPSINITGVPISSDIRNVT